MDYPLWHSLRPMNDLVHALRQERFVEAADGIRVRDASGRWFIDARSGCWNLGLGYGADAVKEAICQQLAALPVANILSYDRPAAVTVDYARALRDAIGSPSLRWVRLGNSGSQMTETAVMLSRLVRVIGDEPERMTLLSFRDSYHGLGLGANAFSGSIAGMEFHGPLVPDVHLVDTDGSLTNNVAKALEELTPQRVTALMIEPIMGTLGLAPDPDDLRALRRLCADAGVHFIADEVSTGFGRTGGMSRCLDLGIEPDLLILSKNLTSGYVPFGAMLVSDEMYRAVADSTPPRALPAGSATDGHPVACAAGLAVLDTYAREQVLDNVRATGEYLCQQLRRIRSGRLSGDVEGAGMMIHFPLASDGRTWPFPKIAEFIANCENRGVLLSMNMRGFWLMPPLVTTREECDEIVSAIEDSLLDVAVGNE